MTQKQVNALLNAIAEQLARRDTEIAKLSRRIHELEEQATRP